MAHLVLRVRWVLPVLRVKSVPPDLLVRRALMAHLARLVRRALMAHLALRVPQAK
jgi:hypothetical protein